MPKGFSEEEKTMIRQRLVEAGRQQFSRFGLKKANVEEITRAAGISKGAFYLFFDSKEALFFEILEQFEDEFRGQLFQNIFRDRAPTRETIKQFLIQALTQWQEHPLLSNFTPEELENLRRRLPPEKVSEHLNNDEQAMEGLMELARLAGIPIQVEKRQATALLKALFLASVHRQEIGADMYLETLTALTGLVVDYLFEG